jgi:hypothetical protein
MPVVTGTVSFLQPTLNGVVGRRMQINIQVSANFGSSPNVNASFRYGSSIDSIPLTRAGSSWVFDGLVPGFIPAGALFTITATAHAQIGDFVTVNGSGSVNAILENVVPAVSIDPFQSPVVVGQLPYTFTLSGSASEAGGRPPYGISQVQYQVGNGPLLNADQAAPGWSRWSATASVPAVGDTVITVRATDPFGAVATAQRTVSILQFAMPAVVDPNAKKTAAGVPTTSSITSWTRLEPQCAGADIGASSSARVFDPLWLMTRQWQVGEFQGEDTGSPVQARVRATNAALTRCYLGELSKANTSAPVYDPARGPLEMMVERRRMRAAGVNDSRMLTLSMDAGLHFLRMVELNATTQKYRPAFLTTYAMQPPTPSNAVVDDASARLIQTMVGRAPDARRLAAAFRHPGTPQIVFDSALKIAAADVAAAQQVAEAWLAWYDSLFAEPSSPADNAWTPSRLEYAVSVSTRLSAQPQDGLTFSATEFDGGRLDWSSFDVNGRFSIDTTGDRSFVPLSEATMPTPVTIPGTPAARFWEMEDAKVAYGLVSAGPTDLAHLMMIEYASSYGNDWYVVPLTTPVGTVTRVDSLVVTDTFGVRSLLRAIGDPALPTPYFSMWQQSSARYAGEPLAAPIVNRFFLPPTIGRSLDSALLEDVLFMRDEMANVAWGIERSIEGAIETPLALANVSTAAADGSSAAPPPAGAPPRYLLSTDVPDNWIPLLPVRLDDRGTMRLKRGAVLQPDGTNRIHHARSEVLTELGSSLLYDEEVPREGVHITRRRRMARWIDGSVWVWTAYRNEVGTGEGSAALRFDHLDGDADL